MPAETAEAAASIPVRPAPTRLGGLRVLLVEDDANTREAMRWTLERAGASVTAVASANDGLAALGETNLDVIVSDLGLPGVRCQRARAGGRPRS